MKAIYILWLRQLKRYVRVRARASLGRWASRCFSCWRWASGSVPTFAKAGGGNYIQFLAPGIVSMGILFTAVFSGIEIIWDRQFGFLKETLVAPVSRLQIVLGRTLGGATVAMIQGAGGLSGLPVRRASDLRAWLLLPVALAFMFLIALLSRPLGTAIGSVLEDMQGFPLIMNFLVMPLFFFSAALFPLRACPGVLDCAVADPLTYGVDGLRGALLGTAQFGTGLDLGVLTALTVLALWLGARLFSKIQI